MKLVFQLQLTLNFIDIDYIEIDFGLLLYFFCVLFLKKHLMFQS